MAKRKSTKGQTTIYKTVNCGEYNIVYLDHTEHCGRYCSGTFMYSETCLNRTSMNPAFVVGIDGCLVYSG
jgi:hypothetical protein